ncbi:MAG: DUF1579 domain-containing protein [Phycisphaerales bacterium]|nr:DUF1579 domain-containing protein [Phycisphaerales bacterium]
MSRTSMLSVAAVLAMAGSLFAQQTPSKPAPAHSQPAGQPEMQLPPGWTPEDAAKCMAAMTPGEQQQRLTESAGLWHGKTKTWMAPGAPVAESTCTTTITPILDGRFVKCETAAELPGMGPFSGFGLYGFDNVTQKYQATWIDNCSTTMMQGTGELSSSGDTLTWTYKYTCPITGKPTAFREIQKTTGKDTKSIEMYGTDPKSGKEFKMMEISLTRTGPVPMAAPAHKGN